MERERRFLGAADAEAADAFYPGWAHLMAIVGRERGWAPPTRAQFADMAGPEGAYLVGAPEILADKVLRANEALGGISRITFLMSTASVEPSAMQRSIELLGGEVAPTVRERSFTK